MLDYLLRFTGEAAAIAALPELRDEDGWSGGLPVVLVTAEAVHGDADEDGVPDLIAPREVLSGFFLLGSQPGLPGEVAAIERETGVLVAGDHALIGARLDPAWAGAASVIVAAEAPPVTAEPVPFAISDRQFAQQLAVLGKITEPEAVAWAARGDLPATLEEAVVALPAPMQFTARMLLSSATTYERSHPLVSALGDLLSYDEAGLDDLWRAAAVL